MVKNNFECDEKDSVDKLGELESEEDGCPVLDSEELQAEKLKNLALLDRKIMENELLVMEQKQLVLKLMSEHQGAFSMGGFSVADVEKFNIELMDPRPQISRVKEMDPTETDFVWSEMIGKMWPAGLIEPSKIGILQQFENRAQTRWEIKGYSQLYSLKCNYEKVVVSNEDCDVFI